MEKELKSKFRMCAVVFEVDLLLTEMLGKKGWEQKSKIKAKQKMMSHKPMLQLWHVSCLVGWYLRMGGATWLSLHELS